MNNDTLFLDAIGQIEWFKDVPQSELYELRKIIRLIPIDEHVAHYFEPASETQYIIPLAGRLLLIRDNVKESRPFSLQLPIGSMWPVTTVSKKETAVGAQAIRKGWLAILSNCNLQQLFKNSVDLRLSLYQSIGLAWQSLTEQASKKANFPLFSQIARLFLEHKVEEDGRFIVRLAHWQLALLLDSHRETISTEIRKMRLLGLIETGRKEIVLINLEQLQRAGDDGWNNHSLISGEQKKRNFSPHR